MTENQNKASPKVIPPSIETIGLVVKNVSIPRDKNIGVIIGTQILAGTEVRIVEHNGKLYIPETDVAEGLDQQRSGFLQLLDCNKELLDNYPRMCTVHIRGKKYKMRLLSFENTRRAIMMVDHNVKDPARRNFLTERTIIPGMSGINEWDRTNHPHYRRFHEYYQDLSVSSRTFVSRTDNRRSFSLFRSIICLTNSSILIPDSSWSIFSRIARSIKSVTLRYLPELTNTSIVALTSGLTLMVMDGSAMAKVRQKCAFILLQDKHAKVRQKDTYVSKTYPYIVSR